MIPESARVQILFTDILLNMSFDHIEYYHRYVVAATQNYDSKRKEKKNLYAFLGTSTIHLCTFASVIKFNIL